MNALVELGYELYPNQILRFAQSVRDGTAVQESMWKGKHIAIAAFVRGMAPKEGKGK
jgi:hypothetical protein